MDIVGFINTHLTAVDTALVYLIVSSAVQALPQPTEGCSVGYVWLYRFCHALVANWKVVGKKVEK